MKEIPLTQGKVALVDDDDYERVSEHKWHALKRGKMFYAGRSKSRRDPTGRGTILLHHFILGIPSQQQIDHRDRDGLNCQKQNIRPCTHAQNNQNRRAQVNNASGYRCVTRCGKRWQAHIGKGGTANYTYLGRFDTAEDAARSYDREAARRYGEFACLNFPSDAHEKKPGFRAAQPPAQTQG